MERALNAGYASANANQDSFCDCRPRRGQSPVGSAGWMMCVHGEEEKMRRTIITELHNLHFLHRFANLPVENLAVHHLSPPPEKYWSMMAYNNAKLCNVLFAQELAQVRGRPKSGLKMV